MSSISVTFVQALYSFKGKNNDELCFKKGDVITLTQKVDGGWWEGTLNEKTGWFPSNYVKEVSDIKSPITSPLSQKRQFYSIVLHDLSESEMKFVNELQGLITNYLNAIEKSSILNNHEYRQLTGNILELLDVHKSFLCNLEENEKKPFSEQKTGKLFLSCAPKLQNVHQTYCSLHPKAACVLDKFKDQLGSFMETCGANCPGIIMLTTGLSKPFRRIDKYSGILQELERHIDENHHDRGDIQRSVAVYNDITAICTATRKQKELELQVLTGPVRGWDGASLAELGDIVHMGSVAIGSQNLDRYFVLFAQNLLILSVSQRMSAFIYEGKLPVSGLDVKRIEDNETYKNAFEITGPITDPIIAVCQTKAEAQYWFDLLRSKTVSIYSSSEKSETTKCPTKAETSERKSADKSLGLFYGLRPNVSMFSSRQKNVTTSNGQGYRSSLTDEQDLTILRVIEAYCNSSSSVRTNSSSEHTTRIESIGELSEQTLIQNVLLIQEQIRELQKNFSQLKNELRNENKLLVPQSLSVSSNRNSNKTLDPVANSDICT